MIIKAHGHENVLSLHRNTIEVTCDKDLTKRGDCILAVSADRMPYALDGRIAIRFTAGSITEEVHATANPGFSSKYEMVIRKTSFKDERTYAINADKAAKDLDRKLVNLLKNPRQTLTVEIMQI